MASAVVIPDIEYGLAEDEIVAQSPPSASTLLDVLARPAVFTPAAESAVGAPRKVVIRTRGLEISVELQAPGILPRSFVRTLEAIAELLTLPPGWNSYSARPIAPQNAIRAIQLLYELVGPATPTPAAVPRVRGGIQLEWHTKSIDIEIYIDSPDHVTFYAEDIESGESNEVPIAGHEDVLKGWVERISGK